MLHAFFQQHQPTAPRPLTASSGGSVVSVSAEKLKPKTYDEIRQRVEEERRKAAPPVAANRRKK